MKTLCSIVLLTFTVSFAFSNPVINAVPGNGNWKNSSTWSLNRVPADGDTVVIPAGNVVLIDDVENLSTDFLYVKVYGALKFAGGKLWLNSNSAVIIFIGGSVTGTGSSSETLRIGGVDKFWGHNDAIILGPAYANITTGISPFGFNLSSNSALPVKFIGFNVAHQNNNVLVEWTTAEEINNDYYEIQRSENGNDWNTIGNVAGAGNTTATHSYSYTDKNIKAGLFYYRIRQVDIDGRFDISPVRKLKIEDGTAEVKVNATSSSAIYVHFSEQVKANVMMSLVSSNGQVVFQKTYDKPVGQILLPAQNAMKGIYIVTVTDGRDLKFSKQILL